MSPTPTAPFGGGAYCYWVVANYPIGHSTPSAPGCTPPVVSASVTVNWNAVSGATSYDVLRTATPILPNVTSNIAVATAVSGPPLTDGFGALSSYSVATAGAATGLFLLDNQNQANPVVRLTLTNTSGYLNSFIIGTGGGGTPGGSAGQIQYNNSGAFGGFTASGDFSVNTGTGVGTLASVNGGPGACGDATHVCQVTTNAKGLTTSQSAIAITAGTGNAPAIVVIGSTTGTVAFNCGSATAGTITAFQAAGNLPIVLSGNLTVTNSGCTPGQELVFLFQQPAGGPFTVTFPAGWVTNDAPCQVHQAASVITKAVFYYDGAQGRLKSCVSTGAFSMGTENTDPAANPPSGFEFAGYSTSRKTAIVRDSSGNFKIAARTACLSDQLCADDTTSVEFCTGGGSANAQTAACTPANQTLVTGLTVRWKPSVANTAATTLGVDALTVKNLTKCGTTALASGDLTTAAVATATYDGTQFQLLNPQAATCGAAAGSLTPTSNTPKWLWGVGYSDATNAGGASVNGGVANGGKTIALTVEGVLQFTKICYHVLAAAGAKGLGIEITNLAGTSVRVLMTAAVIGAGASFGCLSVGSGADTSAGTATLPAGGYLIALTSDDTTLALDGHLDVNGNFCQIMTQNTANSAPPSPATYCSTPTAAFSTGTGSGLTFNAISGTTFTVNTQARFIPMLVVE